jgi:hypothetical protein
VTSTGVGGAGALSVMPPPPPPFMLSAAPASRSRLLRLTSRPRWAPSELDESGGWAGGEGAESDGGEARGGTDAGAGAGAGAGGGGLRFFFRLGAEPSSGPALAASTSGTLASSAQAATGCESAGLRFFFRLGAEDGGTGALASSSAGTTASSALATPADFFTSLAAGEALSAVTTSRAKDRLPASADAEPGVFLCRDGLR